MFIHQNETEIDETCEEELWLDLDKIESIFKLKENVYKLYMNGSSGAYIINKETLDKILVEKGWV